MVTGKVKGTMGLQRSWATPKPSPSSSSNKLPQKEAVSSRSFGAYFPRSSAQVQQRPPDVAELIHLVEELREQVKTELLENKHLKESAAIIPFLKSEISRKDTEIKRNLKKLECLETENERLRQDVEMLQERLCEQKLEFDKRICASEKEILHFKNTEREDKIVSCSQRFQGLVDVSGKSNLMKSLKKSVRLSNIQSNYENQSKEVEELHQSNSNTSVSTIAAAIRSHIPRVPKPPPRPASSCSYSYLVTPMLPVTTSPPPPPPPVKGLKRVPEKVRRIPEVVELYHSLMRRDSRREGSGGCASVANARDMIGEIENRSTHLLAIKTDVETQGGFIRFLIKEVENAAFSVIEDVIPFVKWLDDELTYLVDERAVLKHFAWPEQKADALREAAFGYSDLKKLESEASFFHDDPRQPFSSALKKMQTLFDKLEHGFYNILRMRESATNRYRAAHIPVDWMQDTGYVSQIKLASVKLGMKYIKRVSAELEIVDGGHEEEELIVQGVKFAFRVHQFAGGFDMETMRAFQELRDKANSCHIQCQNQQQQE